jgi:hypothetical protein
VEALIVTDNDPPAAESFFNEIRCESLRGAANIIECVILGDHSAPAVRTE